MDSYFSFSFGAVLKSARSMSHNTITRESYEVGEHLCPAEWPAPSIQEPAGRSLTVAASPNASSRHQLRHHFAVDIRQPKIAALEAEGETFVVQA